MGRSSWIALLVLAAACSSPRPPPPPPVAAKPPPELSSPGPLTAGHQASDRTTGCRDCHVNNTKEIDNKLCLGCHQHQNLAARIAAGQGFHASRIVKGKSCATCHRDHRGRVYDPTGWANLNGGRNGFDHDLTGWPLHGGHVTAPCERCHHAVDAQGIATYMGTDRLCGSCHPDPVHGFARRQMLACERCHTTSAWRPPLTTMRFNHDDRQDAAYPTLGVHHDVTCIKCHPAAKFALGTPKPGCESCHASPHAKHLFDTRDCAWCHSPTFKSLKSTNFDHTARTRFDLGPWHGKLDCMACHTRGLGEKLPSAACESCHPKRSPHKNRFDAFQCATCHSPSFRADVIGPGAKPKWPPNKFDHNRNTKFRLTGKHATLRCRDCHPGSNPAVFQRWPIGWGCMDCHTHAKVHDGKYPNSECQKCHPTR